MKVRGKKSYYNKVLLGLLLVLLVAIVTVVSIFFQAKSKVEEQILIMNRDTLVQSLNHMDEVIQSAADATKSIGFSTKYSALSRRFVTEPERHAYLAWSLQQQLADYVNEKYYDVFVYYPGNDYVISTSNSFARLKDYYGLYYENLCDSWEEFSRVVNSSNKQPLMHSLNGKGEQAYQCVTLRVGSRVNDNLEFVVVVILNQQYMKTVLNQMIAHSEGRGHFFIIGDDKEVVFCTDNAMADLAGDIYQDTDEVYKCTIGDKDYMMLSQASGKMDVYYAYAVSYDYFWSELYDIYFIFLLGILIMTVLGGWGVFWQSRRIYRPVEQTMIKLQEKSNSQWNVDLHTEMEFIESVFSITQEEKRRLHVAVKQDSRKKRDLFISALFEGDVPTSDASEDIFAENGIQLCSNRFCVALLKMECSGELEKNLYSFVVSNVLEELFSKTHRGYVIALAADRYALLINLGSHDDPRLVEPLIDQGLQFLNKNFRMVFTVGIGTEKQGMSSIPEAYHEAVRAMQYRYLLGTGRVIMYSDIKDRVFQWPSKDRMQYAFNDFMAEENCDMSRALQYVDECLKKYHIDSGATLDMVECFVFEVVNNFNRYVGQMTQEGVSRKEQIQALVQSETLAEFRQHFAQLLMRVYGKLREDEKENDICARAKNYIEHHYQDPNLSLAEIAKTFGLTPSYFSKMFKEKYQVSIPDHINLMRIEKAKQLLADTSRSIQTVALEVGFLESSSFIRIFKKIEGITPGVYRSLAKQ